MVPTPKHRVAPMLKIRAVRRTNGKRSVGIGSFVYQDEGLAFSQFDEVENQIAQQTAHGNKFRGSAIAGVTGTKNGLAFVQHHTFRRPLHALGWLCSDPQRR